MIFPIRSFDTSSVGSETTLLNGHPTSLYDSGSRGDILQNKKVAWADLSTGDSRSNPSEIDFDDASVGNASIGSSETLRTSNVNGPGPKESVIGYRKRVTWRDLPVGSTRAWQLSPKKAAASLLKRKIEKNYNDYIKRMVRAMGNPDSRPIELKKSGGAGLNGKIRLARTGRNKSLGLPSVKGKPSIQILTQRTAQVGRLSAGPTSECLLFDTGASLTVTGNPADFVPGSLKPLPPSHSVRGVGGNLPMTHVGLACFAFRDDNNHIQVIQTTGYLVKGLGKALLSPQTYMKELKAKDVWGKAAMVTTADALIFRWPKGNTITLPLHSKTQTPSARLLRAATMSVSTRNKLECFCGSKCLFLFFYMQARYIHFKILGSAGEREHTFHALPYVALPEIKKKHFIRCVHSCKLKV
jgi:hypothetical protein